MSDDLNISNIGSDFIDAKFFEVDRQMLVTRHESGAKFSDPAGGYRPCTPERVESPEAAPNHPRRRPASNPSNPMPNSAKPAGSGTAAPAWPGSTTAHA